MIAIVGFPFYFVRGTDIISQKWGGYRILKQVLEKKGYLAVGLTDPTGKRITKKVHRLIAQAYLSDYSEDLQVDHIDRCRTNNNISNLRMVTNSENQQNTSAKGCSFDKDKNKWKAYIGLNKKLTNLGYHDTEDEARQAYLDAKKLYHPTAPINQE
jgi:hypothetical protein